MKYSAKLFREFEFKQKFFRFLLIDRLMIKKDNLVLITGKRGDGKTTLAIKIILGFSDMEKVEEYYNIEVNRHKEVKSVYKLGEIQSFDFKRDMAFTRKDLQTLCKEHTKGFILADEAIVNAARRNSMTKANKILHEVLTINRKNNNTVFFCLPSIEDFDISILQYVTHWIHIDDRGLGCVLLPEAKSIFGRRTWDVDKMKKTYDKFRDDNPRVISIPYWLFDNFRGYIRFKALPAKVEKVYLKIANAKKNEDSDNEEKAEQKVNKFSLPESTRDRLSQIAEKITKGELLDTADYYSECASLQLTKEKLNKEINKILIMRGEGRPATRIIKDNKKIDDAKYEKQALANKVIY